MKEMKEDGVKAMKTKILVVDDEKPIADILEFNLDKEGYDVFVAYDGNEAIDLVRTEEPDLVLLDTCFRRKMEWKCAVKFERTTRCRSLC